MNECRILSGTGKFQTGGGFGKVSGTNLSGSAF